jgi:uncharacterized FlaG/YvyC family protein
MRVENTFDTRSFVSGDLDVAHVLHVRESDELGALNHDIGRDGQKGDDAYQKKRSALMEAMNVAGEHLKGTGLNIRLKVSDKSERLQVEVFDPKTKEVLRRFPPDEIIRLAESIDEMAGLIVNRSL